MQTVGLREGDEGDRAYWKETINNHIIIIIILAGMAVI